MVGRKSREKQQRRAAPKPPPVGKQQSSLWRTPRVRITAAIAALALIAAVAVVVAVARSSHTAVKLGPALANESPLAGLQTGPPPWPAEHAKLAVRLDQLGLPRLQMEGDVLHIHQHLDLYISGRQLPVPALIGINEQQRYLDPLHTHDASGIIHVESPTKTAYTLGQFFAVWGVRLTNRCIGNLCNNGSNQLRAYVNGKSVTANPARIELAAHQEIVLAYGTANQLPGKIPSSYPFPAGL
jgi:hypothetical protein